MTLRKHIIHWPGCWMFPFFSSLTMRFLITVNTFSFEIMLEMHQFHKGILPLKLFTDFFMPVNSKHHYKTGSSSKSTFSLPATRTNYGKFSIRFCGPKVWNSVHEPLKSLNIVSFKQKLKKQIIFRC